MNRSDFTVEARWVYKNDPEIFNTLRKMTVSHLTAVLGRVLAKADDSLFELAQNEPAFAASPHLDAMRALRMARAPLENSYRRHFDVGFEALKQRIQENRAAESELSLVEDDQLEVQLASEFVIEAIMRAHGPALEVIEKRFARMVGLKKLPHDLNPLSPASLANSIYVAQKDVSLPSNVRVILYKFFERELVDDLAVMLSELNSRMETAGILPELGNPKPADENLIPTHKKAAPVKPSAVFATAAAAKQVAADDTATFDALCQLLRSWRPNANQHHVAHGGLANLDALASRRPMVMSEMVSVLSMLQSQVPHSVTTAMNNHGSSLSSDLKQEMLQNAARIGMPAGNVRLSQEDEDAVDLVGMMFDVLFDERDFEQLARALMARLVVPYVKAAVLDRSMFIEKTHPARRMLNSLSEAVEGNKGEGPQERELLKKAEDTVDRLVAEFNEDMAIFETLEQELRAFLDQHRRRMELAERRATEAQRGQERLEQARGLASIELDRRIKNIQLPEVVDDFLKRCWTHHLSMVALREGADSPAWQSALNVADSLLALLPSENSQSISMIAAMTNIQQPLEAVLASSGITGDSAQQTIHALQASIELMSRETSAAKAAAPPVVTGPQKPVLSVVSNKDDLNYDAEDIPILRNLAVSHWVHLATDSDKLHPAKLSWISPISSRLMFVNRRGVRVLVASLEELAALKKAGKLMVHEQENLFDQTMQSVMGRLKSELN
jgi:Protein of unknown function (DUF1631)